MDELNETYYISKRFSNMNAAEANIWSLIMENEKKPLDERKTSGELLDDSGFSKTMIKMALKSLVDKGFLVEGEI
jgi:DNA-binding MarR family transcriptional regulator